MLDIHDLEFTDSKKSERDEKIIAFMVYKLDELNQYRDSYSDEWKVADDRVWVRGRTSKGEDASTLEGDDDWQTHILFPHEFSVIRQSVASMVRNLPEAMFETYDEQNQWKLEVWKHVWNHAIDEAGWTTQLTYALIDMRIKGVGMMEIGYLEKYKTIKDAIYGKDEDGSAIFSPSNIVDTEEKKILEYDGLYISRIDPNNVWIDQNVVDIHSKTNPAGVVIIKDDPMDIWSFRRKFEGYKNVNAVMPTSYDANSLESMSERNQTEQESEMAERNDEYVHVYRCYLQEDDECYYVANNEVIYDGPIPYSDKKAPLGMLKNIPIPGNMYVPGEVSFLQQISEVMNVMLGLAIDNKKFGLQPHTFIEASDDLDPDDIVTRPEGYTPVPKGFDVNKSLQVWQPPDMSSNIGDMITQMQDLFIQVSGVDTRSLTPPGTEKVTQTLIKREISNSLLDLTIKFNEMNGLKDIFKMMAQKLMEFYPRKKVRNFLNPEGIFEENISFPKVAVKGFKVRERTNKDNPDQVDKIEFEPSEGAISFFEAKPEFIRQQLIINVKEGSLHGSLQELALRRWMELIQLLMQFAQTSPEVAARFDWDKILGKTFQKFQENPDDMLIKKDQGEEEEQLTGADKQIQSLLSGQKLTQEGGVDNIEGEKAIRDYLAKNKGNISPAQAKSLFEAQIAHLGGDLGGNAGQPEVAPQAGQPLGGNFKIPNLDQEPQDAEGMARSLGAQAGQQLN